MRPLLALRAASVSIITSACFSSPYTVEGPDAGERPEGSSADAPSVHSSPSASEVASSLEDPSPNARPTAPRDSTSTDAASTETASTETGSTDATPTSAGNHPSVGSCRVFPADNPWNQDVSRLPVHPNSNKYVESIGRERFLHPDFGTEWEGAPIGIPYTLVPASQPKLPIVYTAYGSESDPGPMPIPLDAPIEGGPNGEGDRHTLVIDESTCTLYELYRAFPVRDAFEADSGTVWDLSQNEHHGEGCTSADAAGLPVFPGLARYDEVVEKGEVLHALRMTVSRSQRAYVFPARHYASQNTDPNLPPMGLRLRMKANYDCSAYSDEVQVLCRALKRFGLIVADNGSNWYVSGAPDPRWNDDHLNDFKRIPGSAFEAVDTGEPLVTTAPPCRL